MSLNSANVHSPKTAGKARAVSPVLRPNSLELRALLAEIAVGAADREARRTAAGILRAVKNDAVALVRRRKRGFSHAQVAQPTQDPQVLQVVGEIASRLRRWATTSSMVRNRRSTPTSEWLVRRKPTRAHGAESLRRPTR